MTKVMCFGAFDGLHIGHLDFFRQAKKCGDYLIVSVGTNKNVEKFKGKAPLFNQAERLELINELEVVDEAIAGVEDDFYEEIKRFKPDVICLGYDQWAEEREVESELAKVGLKSTKVVRLAPYKSGKAKSAIVKKNSVDF